MASATSNVGASSLVSTTLSRTFYRSDACRNLRQFSYWKVENQLHWVLDVVFGEDGHQLRVGNGPRNFTTLRKLAHALIKNGKPKHGIKGTREMAGWNTNVLEEIIRKAAIPQGKASA